MHAQKIRSEEVTLEEKVVAMNRVAKVVKVGRRFALCALVVVGDRKGHVGLGYGKASEVPEAIRKATEDAKKNIIHVRLKKSTIPQQIQVKYASSIHACRQPKGRYHCRQCCQAVLELAGVRDVLRKDWLLECNQCCQLRSCP